MSRCPYPPPPKPIHDCAQVERDNVDLHQALAEAIRRLKHVMYVMQDELRTDDLMQVFDRTSRPAHDSRPPRGTQWFT
jgi:cell division protein FtsX